MKNSFKKSFMFMMLLLALTVSALGVTPALADDGVTPPADAPVVEQPVVDAPVVDAPIVEQPVTDAPAAEPAVEEMTVSEILEQLPEDTGLVVLDASGEALPLASQEAAEAVASSADPYFYDINGVKYSYMFSGQCGATPNCTESSTPIQAAVDAFRNNQNATGEIFILAGTYTENVYINGSDGYLSKLTGLVGAGSGLTTINGSLNAYQLSTTNNPFTLSGITFINNGVSLSALGDVVVDDVAVTGSRGNGLMVTALNGDIFVTDSTFDKNNSTGLDVRTNGGDIILEGVTASGNTYGYGYGYYGYGQGAIINSSSYVCGTDSNGMPIYCTGGDIFVTDSAFDKNYSGLSAYTEGGDVTVKGVSASGNTNSSGANINSGSYFCGTDSHGNRIYCSGGDIFVTDSTFDKNYYGGLSASTSGGDVSLEGVSASGNTNGTGAYLGSYSSCNYDSNGNYNCSGGGDIFVTDSTFDKNNYAGLNAYINGDGDIILEGVTASGTTNGDGVYLSNSYVCGYDSNWNPIYCPGGNIFIVKSKFSDNTRNGAYMVSTGDVSVKCSGFDGNGAYGMDAGKVGGSLDLTSVTFVGNTSGNYNYGGKATVNSIDCNPVPPVVSSVTPPVVTSPVVALPAVEDEKGRTTVQYTSLYTVLEQTQEQLPAKLEAGTFGSALKVALTDQGANVTDLVIKLSFPIPASMKDANLAVMFWDGSAWVEVSGGSVVDGSFVITVAQPGTYILIAK